MGLISRLCAAKTPAAALEQVLAPRFNFTPKNTGPQEGYEYGEGGYDPKGKNIGFNEATGQFHVELKGLVQPETAASLLSSLAET